MIRRDLPWYRSQVVQWTFLLSGAFLTYDLSPWAPPAWHNTPSLIWLHHVFPWLLLSGLFAIYTLLHLWGSVTTTVVGDFLGLFLYLLELLALAVTAKPDAFNPWVFIAFFLAAVFQVVAGRLAVYKGSGDEPGHARRTRRHPRGARDGRDPLPAHPHRRAEEGRPGAQEREQLRTDAFNEGFHSRDDEVALIRSDAANALALMRSQRDDARRERDRAEARNNDRGNS